MIVQFLKCDITCSIIQRILLTSALNSFCQSSSSRPSGFLRVSSGKVALPGSAANQLLIQSDIGTPAQSGTRAHGYGSPAAVTVRSGHTAGSGAGDARRGVVSPGDVGRESHCE